MSFLPPSSEQLRSLSDLIALIKGASDKDVQAVVSQMAEQADAAQKAQGKAASDLAAAQKLSDKTDALAGENAKASADLAKAQVDFNAQLATLANQQSDLAAATAALDKDRKDFEKQKKASLKEFADREASVSDRELAVAAAEAAASAMADEYNSKMSKLAEVVTQHSSAS